MSPPWQLFEAFLAVMQTGSLSGAARALGVTQPTIRRHVDALEEALDAVLFTRAQNGLIPTELAIATLPHAEAIAASTRAFVRASSGTAEAARGTVRVAASEIVGVEILPRILGALATAEPAIQIELVVSNKHEDLVRRDADVAVRMVRPTQAGLVARRAGTIAVGLFATRGYLARHPAPAKVGGLRDHVLVGADRDRGIVDALASVGLELRPSDFALRTDQQVAQLAAVRAGLGIGPCQVPLAARDPELVRVVPKLAFPLEAWVVMHEDLRTARRVRLVFDHLVAAMTAYAG